MRQNQTPDWRRRRAVQLVDNNLNPSRSRDDKHIRRVWRFLKRRRRMDVKAEERLANDMPDLYAAFEIYEDSQCGTRWIFEASVMANRSLAEMSEYLRTDIEVLEAYEIVFFDVRDALDNRGCVVSNVLMPLATNSIPPRDPDILWKGLAYYGGWDIVKSCWEMGHATPAALDFLHKANHEKLIANHFDALHTAHVNSFNAHEFVQLGLTKQKQDFEMGSVTHGNQATTALAGLLNSIRIHVRKSDSELPATEPRLQLPDAPNIIDVEATPSKKPDE
jgi:hypothetical protein